MDDGRQLLLQRQKEIDMNEEKARRQKNDGFKVKEIVDRACKANKKAQAETGTQPPSKQPEKAQAPQAQNNNSAGPKDQSMADVRMENFKKTNGKLAKNKSQLPNLAVQAKIFPPTKKGRRPLFDWQLIPSKRDEVEIWQRGEQLNQLDLTGWLMLIRFATGPELIAEFTRYEFLKAMRKHDSSRDYKWLRGLLSRLGFSQFNIYLYEMENEKKWIRYEGALAPQNYEASKGKFAVQLSKPLYAFFGFGGWSFINMEQRLALGQNQWAQAFHAFLSTNICPRDGFWWTKDDLWKEWGDGYQNQVVFLKKFRSRVLKSLYGIDFIKKVKEKQTAIGIWW